MNLSNRHRKRKIFISQNPSWKTYQAATNRNSFKKILKRIGIYTGLLSFFLALVYSITGEIPGLTYLQARKESRVTPEYKTGPENSILKRLHKNDVQVLIADKSIVNRTEKNFRFVSNGQTLTAKTSLDISLQNYLAEKLDRVNSRHIGIVVMDPSTGKVLSMIGFDKTDPSNNPSTDSQFLAASIFKIVTAAAAIEKCGFNPKTILTYNGSKYTLYKSQLKNRKNRYSNKITFRDSFAQSVNPVFGKIGVHCLGKIELQKYAEAFGFNRNIPFEIPLAPSLISLSDDPYQWAEIASGFNRETTLSPLHGALITSVIFNQGMLVEPTVIEMIANGKGESIYQSRLTTLNRVITPETSKIIYELMKATIKFGTPRKAFRGNRTDKILSKLYIGGKTGSIYNKARDSRYDWFVGFAERKDAPNKIVISVLVAHDKYIGKKASFYARLAIKHYFRNDFIKNKKS